MILNRLGGNDTTTVVIMALYFKMAAVFTGIVGLGYGLYRGTVPTEDNLLKEFSPEIRQKYLQDQQSREVTPQDALYQHVQSNVDSSRPIWMTMERLEAPSVARERERTAWSAKAQQQAHQAAYRKMEEESARLQRQEAELEEQRRRKHWFR